MTDGERHRTSGAPTPNTPRGMALSPARTALRGLRPNRRIRVLGASGMLAATALAILLVAGGTGAAPLGGSSVTLKAPYPGTALHSQSSSRAGCATTSDPTAPAFVRATGSARMVEKASATTCTLANGTSAASANGQAGLEFREPWNVSSTNGSASKITATWSILWTSTVSVTGNGSLSAVIEETDVVATFSVVDLTTNRTVGTASSSHATPFNLTRGAMSINGSAVVRLTIHAALVAGNLYEITTQVSGQVSVEVQGSGARTVSCLLNLATLGDGAVLKSIRL